MLETQPDSANLPKKALPPTSPMRGVARPVAAVPQPKRHQKANSLPSNRHVNPSLEADRYCANAVHPRAQVVHWKPHPLAPRSPEPSATAPQSQLQSAAFSKIHSRHIKPQEFHWPCGARYTTRLSIRQLDHSSFERDVSLLPPLSPPREWGRE